MTVRSRLTRLLGAGLALVCTAALAPAAAAVTVAGQDPAIVRIDSGPIRGAVAADHRSFMGVPYAAPPVGARRWTAPAPVTPWSRVRDATRAGDACPQDSPGNPMAAPSTVEDCLFLNVTVPRRSGHRALPVLVWLHGGGFVFGAGSKFDATRLAVRGDVIVVTINYRFGLFGFLAHPALNSGSPDELSGNYALRDQQAALRWVKRNAAAFGGDPGNVTLFGESAGGASICAQLASPQAKGLFQRVIVQSFPCNVPSAVPLAPVPRSRTDAENQGIAIAAELGCGGVPDVAACLRGKTTSELLTATDQGTGYGPVFGEPFLPVEPAQALVTGNFLKVPVMHGMNHDEQSFMVGWAEWIFQHPTTWDDYVQQTDFMFAADAAAVRAEYPCAADTCAAKTLATLQTDYIWALPTLDTNQSFAKHVPTYAYEFADPAAPYFTGFTRPAVVGAGHTLELVYLFGLDYVDALSPAQRRLGDQMIAYWSRFARGADPNGTGSPWWPRFRESWPYVQSLAPAGIGRTDFGRDHHYEFWRELIK